MLLFGVVAAFAGGREEICYDCLTENVLYRVAGLGDPHPEWWSVNIDEALSVTILFGVIEGGGGLAITPGGKPIPIDPEWLTLVGTYRDSRELDRQLEDLRVSLDRHRLDFAVISDIAETTRLEGTVAVVVPRDEEAAVAWILENDRALAGLDHPTILFLQDGGRALDEILVIR